MIAPKRCQALGCSQLSREILWVFYLQRGWGQGLWFALLTVLRSPQRVNQPVPRLAHCRPRLGITPERQRTAELHLIRRSSTSTHAITLAQNPTKHQRKAKMRSKGIDNPDHPPYLPRKLGAARATSRPLILIMHQRSYAPMSERPQLKTSSIRAILDEYLHHGIEAVCNAVYSTGYEDGYQRASDELREGLEDLGEHIADRITDRAKRQPLTAVREQPALPHLNPTALTPIQRQQVEFVARFPDGITATEYRKQTGHADVGLYKLEKRGVLVKRGPRFFVPQP